MRQMRAGMSHLLQLAANGEVTIFSQIVSPHRVFAKIDAISSSLARSDDECAQCLSCSFNADLITKYGVTTP